MPELARTRRRRGGGQSSTGVIEVPPAPSLTVPRGLISIWHFDEGSGTVIADSSGANNGVTNLGPATPTWLTPGKVGAAALQFPGNFNTHAEVPSSASLRAPSTEVSVCGLVRFPTGYNTGSQGNGSVVVLNWDATALVSPYSTWGFTLNGDVTQLLWGIPFKANLLVGTIGTNIPLDTWIHVCGTFGPTSGMVAYRDGTAVASDALAGSPGTLGYQGSNFGPLTFAASVTDDANVQCDLDEWRVAGVEFTASEASQIATANLAGNQ